MQKYTMIRGKAIEARCANKGIYGSPLYCDCGCQTPRDTDPDINLAGVTVSRKADTGYADYILSRNGKECGTLNTQHNYIVIDGYEFLGVNEGFISDLLKAARSVTETTTIDKVAPAGDSLEETAARVAIIETTDLAEQDRRNANHPGYCTKCHSFCYGDCEAN